MCETGPHLNPNEMDGGLKMCGIICYYVEFSHVEKL